MNLSTKNLIRNFTTLTFVFAAGAAAAAPLPALGGKYATSSDSTATFEAVGRPSLLKIKGEGAKVTGQLTIENNDAKGAFELNLEGFNTGIETRDHHMKEKYLEIAKFPKANLVITHVELPANWKPGTDVSSTPFQGQLTLKGVTKPVSGHVKISGESLATEAEFSISLKEFPVGVPSYLGITVADAVNVTVKIPSFAKQ